MSTQILSKRQLHKQQIAARRKQLKIRDTAIAAGAILLLIALGWMLLRSSGTQSVAPPRIGAALGEFSLSDINGKNVRLSDYQGKPVLINAWATWCPPCKAEMPLLNQYYQSHASQGFTLLAVNAGDSRDQAASFANQNGLAFPVLLDPGTRLLGQMAIDSFPTSILIGRDGKVKAIHVGMFTPESLESEVSPLLAP